MPQPTTMDELMSEFEFEVPTAKENNPTDGITIDMGTEEDKEAAKLASDSKKDVSEEAKDLEKDDDKVDKPKEDLDTEKLEKSKEELETEAEDLEKAKEQSNKGNNSGYKEIALKYIEKGNWAANLAVEDADGNETLVSDLEEIDEDTFFQIEEAVKAQAKEDSKDKFISIEGVEDRKKTIMNIVKEGGDLTQIFNSPEEMEDYINPFSKLDLDNESVQERVYLNALIKHNKLDAETAQVVVNTAKKDLSLDTKVKSYIDQYTESFDKYVVSKKEELIETKKEEAKAQREFKKSLKEQYKAFEIKDTLASKLADSAVNKVDGEFEIDSVYAKKMEDPTEAAELILFLTDKKAYIDFKMKNQSLEQHKQTRQKIKLIPRDKTSSSKDEDTSTEKNSEFDFVVPVRK